MGIWHWIFWTANMLFTTIKKEAVVGVPMVVSSELSLVDDMALREKVIDRIDVLDKVKKLFLIPGLEMMTTKQVAEFYEVDVYSIHKCYQRNIDEITNDGVVGKNANQFSLVQDVQGKSFKGFKEFDYGESSIRVPYAGKSLFFSKRAVLRIGMLLRDSEVAKEVRTQLLYVLKKTPDYCR